VVTHQKALISTMVFNLLKCKFNSNSVEKKIAEIAKSSDEIANEVVSMIGLFVKTNARHYVPVDTGALKASIDMEVKGNVATIGSPLEYAAYVEYGTQYQAPQPYLTPAINDAHAALDSIVKGVMKKYVND